MAVVATEYLDRAALTELQGQRLRALLREVLPANPFYARKLAAASVAASEVRSLTDLPRLPFTTKAELIADQAEHPPYGTVLTYPPGRYSRLHQTSGTTSGQPLRWLDTPASWDWLLGCWEIMYRIMGLRPDDRLFFAFSFGPFLFGWTASEGAWRLGNLCLPGGGMSSAARLRFLLDNAATVLLATPTYALHLAEVAAAEGLDLAGSSVRAVVVGGEPGGSIPPTRQRIEQAWGARVFDHAGMTEAGCLMMECSENPAGLHLLESEVVAEVVEPATGEPVPPGQAGELVLTNLGRWGSPALRYRTGDLVRVDPRPCPCGRTFLRLDGGVLGRTDDMIHVRGNNLYPSALEAVIRRFPEVAEYRVEVEGERALPVLRVQLEPATAEAGRDIAARVDRAIRDELLFRAEVSVVEPGSLPRFELKARRLVRSSPQRHKDHQEDNPK
jgi:phenylacetate-CoA ligase